VGNTNETHAALFCNPPTKPGGLSFYDIVDYTSLTMLPNIEDQKPMDNYMSDPNILDRERLLMQLENYRVIIHVNINSAGESLFAKDELDKKLDLAQSHINQSYEWEKLGDQAKYNDALSHANMIILEVGSVITHFRAGNTSPDDRDPPFPKNAA
jgi:hypothetical protein